MKCKECGKCTPILDEYNLCYECGTYKFRIYKVLSKFEEVTNGWLDYVRSGIDIDYKDNEFTIGGYGISLETVESLLKDLGDDE